MRQLENVLFQAVSLCEGGTVKAEHIRLPDYGAPQPLGDCCAGARLRVERGEVVFRQAVMGPAR
ncbi:hypothetical protein AKG06_33285 [Pseudomonas aeruginosa]|nr:hypothetical protein AKG06_33285 [Pseudomonas aeruginosa]